MRLRCQHRAHHDRQVLDDHLERQLLERQSLGRRLDEGYQNQHQLDVVRHPDAERRCEGHRPVLGEHLEHHLGEVRHLGEGHGPCPGLS